MEESLRLASSLNVPDVVAERQVQLANILLHMGEYELATKHLEVALESVSGRDRPRLAGIASGHLALARLHGGRTEEAKELITKALGLNEIVALEADRVHLLIIGGRVSLASGDVTAARKMVEQALVYVMHAGMDKELAEIRHLQHELEKKDGNAVEALSALEAYMEVYERILGQQRQRALAILEAELRVKEQNREHKRAMESERRLREHQYSLLVNIVPQQVAERLMGGEQYIADAHTEISIFFLDLVNFTSLASRISPDHVIHLLNNVFLACDAIVLKHGLTKVKTIGDSYMAIAGAPVEQPDNVVRMARAVLEVQEVLSALEIQMPEELGDRSWVKDVGELEVRIGVHCGPVSAGVIGELRMAYDVWGDAVNIAARLEQSGLPGHIQTSAEFRSRLLEQEPGLAEFTLRGTVQIKGKGAMETWWMHRPKT
jgi:class 3 adenylate cyclase